MNVRCVLVIVGFEVHTWMKCISFTEKIVWFLWKMEKKTHISIGKMHIFFNENSSKNSYKNDFDVWLWC